MILSNFFPQETVRTPLNSKTRSSGNCSVGLTGLSGFYGSASADFYLSNNSESSNTSTINLSIDFTCPSGYVRVSANTDHGINNDFCVMAYEAKDDGGANPISQANNTPWVSISANNALTKCQSLGAKYDLISNLEWMTIAREIEGISSNWSGASIGSGCVSRGNHNGSTCGYNNAAIDFGTSRNSLASLALLSGEVIWDFSGNVYEWVQWTAGGSYENSPYSCTGGWVEFNGVSCSGIPLNDFSPNNNSYGSAEGMGQFFGGTNASITRGGGHNGINITSGIYHMSFNNPTSARSDTGFRCVYRP